MKKASNKSSMKNYSFSPRMKMADLILANHINLLVLSRFGIHLGFADKTVEDVCLKYKVNTDLFVLICNIFYDHDFEASKPQIAACPADEMISFLKKSHQFYRIERLPEIKSAIQGLSASCSPMHGKALERFFDEYYQEIEKHLSFEDQVVFPYIEELINYQRRADFTIKQFEDNHENIEIKLDDLKNIIIKYIPENDNDELRKLLLDKLFIFEEDLNRHQLIEDKLLVPMVLLLESKTA
jgi:regulator of cell morphogenesis and NO signaling